MIIFVKPLRGEYLELDIDEHTLVEDLFAEAVEYYNIPQLTTVRLIYTGKQLAYDRKVFDYGVKEEHCIHLVIRQWSSFRLYMYRLMWLFKDIVNTVAFLNGMESMLIISEIVCLYENSQFFSHFQVHQAILSVLKQDKI